MGRVNTNSQRSVSEQRTNQQLQAINSNNQWNTESVAGLDNFLRKRRPNITDEEVLELRTAIINGGAGSATGRPQSGPAGISRNNGLGPNNMGEDSLRRKLNDLESIRRSDKQNMNPHIDMAASQEISGMREQMMMQEAEIISLKRALQGLSEDRADKDRVNLKVMEGMSKEKDEVVKMNLSLQMDFRNQVGILNRRYSDLKAELDGEKSRFIELQSQCQDYKNLDSERQELLAEVCHLKHNEETIIESYDSKLRDAKVVRDTVDEQNKLLKGEGKAQQLRLNKAYERIEKLSSQLQFQKEKFSKHAIEKLGKSLKDERNRLAGDNDRLKEDLEKIQDVFTSYKAAQEEKLNNLERTLWTEQANKTKVDQKILHSVQKLDDYEKVFKTHFPDITVTEPDMLDALLKKLFVLHSQYQRLNDNQNAPKPEVEGPREARLEDKAEIDNLRSYSSSLELDIKSLKSTINLLARQSEAPVEKPTEIVIMTCNKCEDNKERLAKIPSLENHISALEKLQLDVNYERDRVRTAHTLNQDLTSEIDGLTIELAKVRSEGQKEIQHLKDEVAHTRRSGTTEPPIESVREVFADQMKTLRQVIASILGWEIYIEKDDRDSEDDEGSNMNGTTNTDRSTRDLFNLQLRSIYLEPNIEGSLSFRNVTREWMEKILLGEVPSSSTLIPELVLEGNYRDRYNGTTEASNILKDYKVGSSNDWYPHFFALINIDDYKKRVSRKGNRNG